MTLAALCPLKVLLAPMVGLSHVALRESIKRYLKCSDTLWPTEMLNAKKVVRQDLSLGEFTQKSINERGLYPQILANEERVIAPAVAKLESWGAQALDINMGCPVKKIARHNYGVSLMGDPEYAADVVRMTVRNTQLPVSVKLRGQESTREDFLLHFTEGLEKAGASWLIIHPRCPDQKRRGNANWQQISLLKKERSIPIVGNGDIQNLNDGLRMFEGTNCDALMIGRALCARPWLLAQLAHQLTGTPLEENIPNNPEEEAYAYGEFLLYFCERLEVYFETKLALKKLFFLLRVGSPWLNWGHVLTKQVQKAQSLEEAKNIIRIFFQKPHLRMSESTFLRY